MTRPKTKMSKRATEQPVPEGLLCSPDDGSTRAEFLIASGSLAVCLWRCEELGEEIAKDLRSLGVELTQTWQGRCEHE